jgi:hypothetical protein
MQKNQYSVQHLCPSLKMPIELSECHLVEVYITKEVSIPKALPGHFRQWLMEQQEGKD